MTDTLVRIFALGVFFVLGLWALSKFNPRDSTDPPEGRRRSGMVIVTDHLTGCQYLARPLFGGVSPRLAADGRQLGCKPIDNPVNTP